MTRKTVLLVVAILAAVFALLAAESGDGEVIFSAVGWLGVSVGCLAAAHLP